MRKSFLIVVILLFGQSFFAQIVFCPSGAKWHFLNKSGADSYPFERYEAVEYLRDSTVNGITAKVLNHTLFYTSNSEACRITLIKQVGDTVFLRNKFTQHTWQVLYNFNTTIGQGWQNSLHVNTYTATVIYNFTTKVDSVRTFINNGTNFKQMFVSVYLSGNPNNKVNSIITERYGANRFLFYWSMPTPFFEVNYFTQILCYEDQNWPLQLFSSKPCNYSNSLGLIESTGELKNIKVFPNPVLNVITIKWESEKASDTVEIKIYNSIGEKVKQSRLKNNEEILMDDLSNGLYFIEVYSNNRPVYISKIIKD